MLGLYNLALSPLRLLAVPWAALRSSDPESRREWRERTARDLPPPIVGGIWIHGASVGESRIVAEFARSLRARRPDLRLAVSATTRTGRKQLPSDPEVDAAFFLPLDFPTYVRKTLAALRPAVLVLVETELWPNLLAQSSRDGIRVCVVNGRLSTERMGRYRRFSRLFRPLLAGLASVGARSGTDADRFAELGVPRNAVCVTGNVKYDLPPPPGDALSLKRELGVPPERPVLVAGSTAAGEDAAVLSGFQRARASRKDLLLILAPRHPERSDDVERQVRERDLSLVRLSALPGSPVTDADVLLVDVVGHLARLYRLASVAFVGGSLVRAGGHNVLEPAAVGVPVLFGPHTDHFAEAVATLESGGGGVRVADGEDLGRTVTALLGDESRRSRVGAAAENAIRADRGAMARSIDLVLSTLDRGPTGPGEHG